MAIYFPDQSTPDPYNDAFDTDERGSTLLNYYNLAVKVPVTNLPSQGGTENIQGLAPNSPVQAPITHGDGAADAPASSAFSDNGFFLAAAGGQHSGGGAGGGGKGSGTPAPWSTQTIAGNNLNFVITWDSSVGKAPSGFVSAFETAVLNIQKSLNSPYPDTITLNVGWGEAGGSRLPVGALGESLTNINLVSSYADLLNALSPYAYLPSADPISGSNYWMASAEQRALNLGPISGSPDGSVGFSSAVSWNFGTGTGSGYDFISIAEHEISEAMGRIGLLGASVSDGGTIYQNGYSPMDLFRYSAPGQLSLVGGQTAYFSPDGGSSSGTPNQFTYFNSTAGGDWGDWQSSGQNSAGNDAYVAFASSGTQYALSNVDQTLMNVLGYHS